jgi:hypothetical protein
MAIGGVDTYYDYDERQWKYRRLGGGPVHKTVGRPEPLPANVDDQRASTSPRRPTRASESGRATAEPTGR